MLNKRKKKYFMKNLVLLRPGKEKGKNIFLIHAGNGEIQNYVLFSSHISPNVSCWAIRANRFKNHTPANRTIPMMAKQYVEIIKSVQPHGPYYIAGWCFGGIRAFEIASKLESMGNEVRFLTMFNSHVPITDLNKRVDMVMKYSLLTPNQSGFTIKSNFNESSEKLLLKKWLGKTGINWDQLEKIQHKKLWNSFIKEFSTKSKLTLIKTIKEDVPLDRALAIPYYESISLEKLLYYLAVMRTDANAQAFYKPKHKVNAKTYYFGAKESLVVDRENWNQYTANPIVFKIVSGTHFSIFHPGDVEPFAKDFNLELMKYISYD